AEDGIRDGHVTGVQTCALPIFVEISADLARRREMGGDLEPVLLIRCWRQHAGLELRSAAHLLGALRDHSLESVQAGPMGHLQARSEERRVGKECRSRGWRRL